jgi:hypothetical protein
MCFQNHHEIEGTQKYLGITQLLPERSTQPLVALKGNQGLSLHSALLSG